MEDRMTGPARARRAARAAAGLALVAFAAALLAIRRGWLTPRPAPFAVLAGAAALALAAVTFFAARQAARGPRRLAPLAEALAAGGLLLTAAAGFAHWALRVQGLAIAAEREPVRLWRTEDLPAFAAGPLARRSDLAVTLGLARLELRPDPGGGFHAVSHLKALDATGEEVALEVARGRATAYRDLRLHQGAFGFAPHVVVARDGKRLLDAFVPFRTVREGRDGVSFLGDFELAAEGLLFHGAVLLDGLDDDMKGHPKLQLAAEHGGAGAGAGLLRPGESVVLGDGTRVTFAGLRRWSEIDFARKTYPVPMIGGLALSALGALLRAVAAWRAR